MSIPPVTPVGHTISDCKDGPHGARCVALLEALTLPLIVVEQGCATYLNPAAQALFDMGAERDRCQSLFAAVGGPFSLLLAAPDGERLYHASVSSLQFEGDDDEDNILVCLTDQSERIAVERRLREAEARWQFALVGSGDAVWDWNIVSGDILFTPRFAAMLGYEEGEFDDGYAAWEAAIHPDDVHRVRAQLDDYITGRSERYLCEFRMRCANGDYLWIQDRGLIVARDAQGRPTRMVGTQRDISAVRSASETLQRQLIETLDLNARLEEAQLQLVQSEKLASIGQIAAGVAHEMNTPLGFVSSNFGSLQSYANELFSLVEALHQALQPDATQTQRDEAESRYRNSDIAYMREDLPALLAETREGLERVQGIVRDLRDFSRVGERQWQLADLRRGLDSTLNILRNQLKHKVEVVRDYGEIPLIWCIPSQLNQVFLNLLSNAAQAIPDHGRITISTAVEGEQIVIRITDTGCGIPPEHLRRIFDPFFTTKPTGKGTGLGLSLSLDIVRKHHGDITATSEPGEGSVFTVTLPAQGEPEFA